MAPTPSTVSFTVRRPTPVTRPSSSGPESDSPFKIPALPRHLSSAGGSAASSPLAGSPRTFSSREDSDDDGQSGIVFANGPGADSDARHTDSSDEEDLVASANRLSGQRPHQKKKRAFDPEKPLIIPTQPNPDWREAARKRRAACSRTQPRSSRAVPSFVPDSALATTGADGSVGGLGTRDTINAGPHLSGLQISKKVELQVEQDDAVPVSTVSVEQSTTEIEETEDQRALRAILAGGDDSSEMIFVPPVSEADALKQDVQELPDVATADDYERVPVSAFGAAMLRGMGWTDGPVAPTSDKRRQNGLGQLYLPQARPALLGIGAKEREPEDDGSGKKKPKRPDMRYIPVTRKEGADGSSRSGSVSDRNRDRGDDSRRRTKDYDDRGRERRDRDRDRDVERDHARGRRDYHDDRDRDGKGRKHDRTRDRDKRDRRDDR